MSPGSIVLWSSILTYGAPIGIAVWQIWSLRRRGGDGRDPPPTPEPRPLPDCLQPHVLLARGRIPQDA